jgi:hypothetical protein
MVVKLMPASEPAKPDVGEPAVPARRKKRDSAIFDRDGHEVTITMVCRKCQKVHPLAQFGLRQMADGSIRNQPWCRDCRGAAGQKKPAAAAVAPASPAPAEAPAAAAVVAPTEEPTS